MLRRTVHMLGRAFRETGQALDRLGLTVAERDIFNDTFTRHRPIMNLYDLVSALPSRVCHICCGFQAIWHHLDPLAL